MGDPKEAGGSLGDQDGFPVRLGSRVAEVGIGGLYNKNGVSRGRMEAHEKEMEVPKKWKRGLVYQPRGISQDDGD